MKEAGDGLHAQMNSMMGALQELKLLQVQTALEQLDISGRNPNIPIGPASSLLRTQHIERPLSVRRHHRSSLETSPSTSSLESESFPLPRGVPGYMALQEDYCGPHVSPPPEALHQNSQPPPQMSDLPRILHSLSREGPSLDSDSYQESSAGDTTDWTSSLMSRGRNRQPLVLGDNVFADLVGNWLDLPEPEKGLVETTKGEEVEEPAHPLRLSRSQEIYRKFSITANIFRKFLRSVRPDKDKLLKEKPGWLPLDSFEDEPLKRPKKADKAKGPFYLPFRTGSRSYKGGPCPRLANKRDPTVGLLIDRIRSEVVEKPPPPVFDYNTAVWV